MFYFCPSSALIAVLAIRFLEMERFAAAALIPPLSPFKTLKFLCKIQNFVYNVRKGFKFLLKVLALSIIYFFQKSKYFFLVESLFSGVSLLFIKKRSKFFRMKKSKGVGKIYPLNIFAFFLKNFFYFKWSHFVTA